MTTQLATVWIFTREGRDTAGHTDTEAAWAYAHSLPPRSPERGRACSWFNPVEINITPGDVAAAVAKWERIAQHPGVCHIELKARKPGMTVNRLYP